MLDNIIRSKFCKELILKGLGELLTYIRQIVPVYSKAPNFQQNRVVCGIYCIRNVLTNQLYIGSSYNVGNRINQHCKTLLEGSHHNRLMQSDFNFYDGQTCLFKYRLLKQLSNKAPAFYIHAIENKYIVEYRKKQNLYNIATPSKSVGMSKITMNLILLKIKLTNLFDK